MNKSLVLACQTVILSLLTVLTASTEVKARVTLPGIFSNNMVLQRNDNVKIWGNSSNKNVIITTSWNRRKYTVSVNNTGNWNVSVSTPVAGGPYFIIFDDGEKLTLQNILIGEVWVCSGQSNMEMPLKGYKNQPVLNADSLIKDADNHPAIRIFRVPKIVSPSPLKDCKGSWYENNSKNAPDFSAIAYQYALILNKKLQVPIGIIATYWGGTAIQSWMSENNLKQFSEVWSSNRLDTIKNPEAYPEKSPAILYNSMIAPIAGFTIKGFVWYQGESNRYNPLLYKKLMPAMVKEWRDNWHSGELPFYYVQIAPYGYSWKNNYFSAILREVQLQVMDEIPNSGMAVILDAGKEKFIHPPDKTTVSERLSYWALAKIYHKRGIAYASPVFEKMEIKDGKAILSFDHAKHGLTSNGKTLSNFEIAGRDSVFYPAKALIIHKNKVTVYSTQVQQPVAVRYAFKNWVAGDLFNVEGLPASSFRTDSW